MHVCMCLCMYVCVCVCACVCTALPTAYMWRSEDNLQVSVPFFYFLCDFQGLNSGHLTCVLTCGVILLAPVLIDVYQV